MDILIDTQYAKQLSNRLELCKVVSSRPFKQLFRCPVCGDSRTNKFKTRGSIYEGTTGKTKGTMLFNCFNCDNHGRGAIPFSLFLKENFPAVFEQYRMEKFRSSNQSKQKQIKTFQSNAVMPKPKEATVYEKDFLSKSKLYDSISELKETHPVRRYVAENRQLPGSTLNLLGFTAMWYRLCNQVRPDMFNEYVLKYDHPRLVIPIYTKDGLVAIQGRALRKQDEPRYQTIKIDDEFEKIYGTERVEDDKPVIYVEGPIDSLFIDTAYAYGTAITGGSVSPENAPFKERRIWALDNEPRSKDTVARMQKLIKEGEKVVIWDKLPVFVSGCKDLNLMIQTGWNQKDMTRYMLNNAVSGLSATLRLNKWKHV